MDHLRGIGVKGFLRRVEFMRISQELLIHHSKSFQAGEVIFREGEEAREMYVILRGSIEIFKEVGDSRKILNTFKEGDLFGEMALVDEKPRSATAVSRTDVDLFVIGNADLERIVKHQPEFVLKIVRVLSNRLRQADTLIEDLLTKDRKNMVVAALIEFARSRTKSSSFRGQSIIVTEFVEWASGRIGLSETEILKIIGILEKSGAISRSSVQTNTVFLEERIDRRSR